MNWKEIKEKYPKAFELWKKWWMDNYEYESLTVNQKFLYDFFDENKIIIGIMWTPGGNVLPSEYMVFAYDFCIDGLPAFESKGYYKTRTEAEEQAFLKAFEILEDSLKF